MFGLSKALPYITQALHRKGIGIPFWSSRLALEAVLVSTETSLEKSGIVLPFSSKPLSGGQTQPVTAGSWS